MNVIIILSFLLLAGNNACAKTLVESTEKIINSLIPVNAVLNTEEHVELVNNVIFGNHEDFIKEVTMNITELITSNGFKAEEHRVETKDGYILGLFRIRGDGPVVFLMHGLIVSSDDWVTPGRDSGFAYLLAERGFDVWMGNARGNKHSRRHKTLSTNSPEFWNFTFCEIGLHDITAMIDCVLEATNQSELIYIGHSQGTTNFFVMASEKPEYNSKVKLMVALAPVAAVPHIRSPLFLILRAITFNQVNLFFRSLQLFGIHGIFSENALTKFIAISVCGNRSLQWICEYIVNFATGFDFTQLNHTTLPTIFSHIPAGSSSRVFEHYGQTVASGEFRKFDYGAERNVEEYGCETPPEYPVGNITTPIALIYGANDKLTDLRDVLTLSRNLRSVVKHYEVPCYRFDHLDFLYAKDFKKLVFPHILELINKHS